MHVCCCSARVATVTRDLKTTRPRCHWNTDPAVTTSDCRCRLRVRCRDHTTRHGRCRSCRTPWKSNTCRCSARKRTCEWTSSSTVHSTASYSLKVRVIANVLNDRWIVNMQNVLTVFDPYNRIVPLPFTFKRLPSLVLRKGARPHKIWISYVRNAYRRHASRIDVPIDDLRSAVSSRGYLTGWRMRFPSPRHGWFGNRSCRVGRGALYLYMYTCTRAYNVVVIIMLVG